MKRNESLMHRRLGWLAVRDALAMKDIPDGLVKLDADHGDQALDMGGGHVKYVWRDNAIAEVWLSALDTEMPQAIVIITDVRDVLDDARADEVVIQGGLPNQPDIHLEITLERHVPDIEHMLTKPQQPKPELPGSRGNRNPRVLGNFGINDNIGRKSQ